MIFESSRVRRYVRRALALAIVLAYSASAAEAVLGVVRDGDVHHESTVAAAVHRAEHLADHGYQHVDHDAHGSDHGHGSSQDHCTHVHGVSLPTLCDFEFVAPAPSVQASVAISVPSDVVPSIRLRPPIA